MPRRPIKLWSFRLPSFALWMLLFGCALTDHYYVVESSGGAGPFGAGGVAAVGGALGRGGALNAAGDSAIDGAGGTASSGGSSALGGDTSSGGGSGGSDAGLGGSVANGGATATFGGSTAAGGDTSASGGVTAGGTASAGGRTSSGGAPVSSGGSTALYEPACPDSVVKGSACTFGSPQQCFRSCGPDSLGFKSETCQSGAYVEEPGCNFPSGPDYSCYKIPTRLPAACPLGVPRAARACQVPSCTVCFGGTITAPTYEDSTGAQKNGYCVCSDTGSWTCASVSSWPCPDAAGCN